MASTPGINRRVPARQRGAGLAASTSTTLTSSGSPGTPDITWPIDPLSLQNGWNQVL
ncbi:MAG: hypothetical protein WA476_08035 [Acidobacteriaceae bacterium]